MHLVEGDRALDQVRWRKLHTLLLTLPLLQHLSHAATPHPCYDRVDLQHTRTHLHAQLLQFFLYLNPYLGLSLGRELLLENVSKEGHELSEVLGRVIGRHSHVDSFGYAVRLLSDLLDQLCEGEKAVFGHSVGLVDIPKQLFVVLVPFLGQEVEPGSLLGLKVLQLKSLVDVLQLLRFPVVHLSRDQFLQHLSQVVLNRYHVLLLGQALPVVLGYQLGQDVEVLLIEEEQFAQLGVHLWHLLQSQPVLLHQHQQLEHFLPEHLAVVQLLGQFPLVDRLEVALEVAEQVAQVALLLLADVGRVAPLLPLPVELGQRVPQEGLVAGAEVVVVAGEDLLGPLQSDKGLGIVLHLEVADPQVGVGEGVGGQVLDCLLVALDGVLVVPPVLVDVAEVVVGVAVAGVDLDGPPVPPDGPLLLPPGLVDDGEVVVGRVVLGGRLDALPVALLRLLVLLEVVVADAHRVLHLVVAGVGQLQRPPVPLDAPLVLALVVVGQPHVVHEEEVLHPGVLPPQLPDHFVRVLQLVEDVAGVLVGRLVLGILLHRPEVPVQGRFVLLLQLVVDSDVVVAGGVLRNYFDALLVPPYRLIVLLLRAPVGDARLVHCPSVLGVDVVELLEGCDLVVDVGLVAGQHEQPPQVLGVDLEQSPRHVGGFGLLHSLVLVDEGYGLKGRFEVRPQFDDLPVHTDGLLVGPLLVENVPTAHQDLVVALALALHPSVPRHSLLDQIVIVLEGREAQSQSVVRSAFQSASLDLLVVPAGHKPLVVTQHLGVVTHPVDTIVPLQVLLDDLLIELDSLLDLPSSEQAIGLLKGHCVGSHVLLWCSPLSLILHLCHNL